MTLLGLIYALSTEMPSLGIICRTFTRDVKASYLYFRTLGFIKRSHYRNITVVDHFRNVVQKYGHRTCFIFEGHHWTFKEVDEFSNRVANHFQSRGVCKGDEVALLLDNCPEYAGIWLGLAKIGAVTALINTNQRKDTLAHSINVVNVKAVIFGRNYAEAIKDSLDFLKNRDAIDFYCFAERGAPEAPVGQLPPSKSLNPLLEEASPAPITSVKLNCKDKLLFIYTSGTTGLPKAAIIRHSRFLWISAGAQFTAQLHEFETIYNPLPMYHTAGGLLFLSVVFIFGGTMVLRRKFSASNFWKEAALHRCTVGQYIGEICRYLLNQPPCPEERGHCLRLMFGNGLRGHIWGEFQNRFRIPRIIELYGATEGNANLVNMFGKVGAVGFIPRLCDRLYPVYLIKVDPETGAHARNAKGLCVRCKPGEPGELVGKIVSNPINSFDGYADRRETNKKIIRDCFEKGDMAFLSGDVLVMDDEGYVYFVDRTGDTFRWRGENVSTGEVENVVSTALGHVDAVVYGVEIPGVEGRAGMAAIRADASAVDFNRLFENVSKRLPSYAVPLFVRCSPEIEATGTYKLRKVTLQREGFDPSQVADPIFFLDAKRKTYVPYTRELHKDVIEGRMRL